MCACYGLRDVWYIHIHIDTHIYIYIFIYIVDVWYTHIHTYIHIYIYIVWMSWVMWRVQPCSVNHLYLTWLIHMWHASVTCDVTHYHAQREAHHKWMSHVKYKWVTEHCCTRHGHICRATLPCATRKESDDDAPWLEHSRARAAVRHTVILDMTRLYVIWLSAICHASVICECYRLWHTYTWHG